MQNLNIDGDAEEDEYFVNSGIFSVPVFKGSVNSQLVSAILIQDKPLEFLNSIHKSGKI